MTITRVKLENFTVFESLDLEPSPGINVLVGANGTGKTHLMKVCYAACEVSKHGESFIDKLVHVFLPSRRGHWRLVKRRRGSSQATIEVFRREQVLSTSFFNRAPVLRYSDGHQNRSWEESRIESVYIPAKEMLANAPGFRSLYANREVHFEGVYADILDRAFLPQLRNNPTTFRHLVRKLQEAIGGRVRISNEEFSLRSQQGTFEFSLLAEGLRKLGLLWLLLQNGTLRPGAVLFWDEPETNLNPKLYGVVVDVLLELQRLGVQVFLATHDYVILKELDLRAKEGDKVAFHSLYRSEETGEIVCRSTDNFLQIHPNVISEVFDSIYDRDVRRALEGVVK